MSSFWSTEVRIAAPNDSMYEKVRELIDTQSRSLYLETGGAVIASIAESHMFGITSLRFVVMTSNNERGAYELFVIRFQSNPFKGAVQNYHIPSREICAFGSFSELEHCMRTLLSAKETTRIINVLAREFNGIGHGERIDSPALTQGGSAPRNLLIGSFFHLDGKGDFAHVSLFGVGGFIKKETILKLREQPGPENGLAQPLDGRIVISVQFEGDVKFLVSEAEFAALQTRVSELDDESPSSTLR